MAAASTESAKSTVPTTSERCAGSATKGVAYSDFSAQPYSRFDDSVVRATAPDSPPRDSSQRIWSASRNSVATAGVLYVWSLDELSTAIDRSRKPGIQRPDALISATRASASPDMTAIQSPPSAAKDFCGAK